jgi:hypothetical protein
LGPSGSAGRARQQMSARHPVKRRREWQCRPRPSTGRERLRLSTLRPRSLVSCPNTWSASVGGAGHLWKRRRRRQRMGGSPSLRSTRHPSITDRDRPKIRSIWQFVANASPSPVVPATRECRSISQSPSLLSLQLNQCIQVGVRYWARSAGPRRSPRQLIRRQRRRRGEAGVGVCGITECTAAGHARREHRA